MALTTGGFARSSTQINPGLVDPRLLAARYDNIIKGAGQGLQLVDEFGRSRELSLARDEALQNRDARIAATRSQLELAPQMGRNQLALSNVARTTAENTPIELGESFGIAEQPRFDANGKELATPDILLNRTVTEINPVTGERNFVTRNQRPIMTREQQLAQEASEQLRIEQNEIRRLNAENAAIRAAQSDEARARSAAETARSSGEREKIAREGLELRKQAEERLSRQSENSGNTDGKRLTELSKTILPNGMALDEYLTLTRNTDGSIRTQRKPNFFLPESMEDQVPVGTNPEAEAVAQQYFALRNQMNGGGQIRQAPVTPSIAAPANPIQDRVAKVGLNDLITGAAPQPQAPARPDVRQNGIVYRWDGRQYLPVN